MLLTTKSTSSTGELPITSAASVTRQLENSAAEEHKKKYKEKAKEAFKCSVLSAFFFLSSSFFLTKSTCCFISAFLYVVAGCFGIIFLLVSFEAVCNFHKYLFSDDFNSA